MHPVNEQPWSSVEILVHGLLLAGILRRQLGGVGVASGIIAAASQERAAECQLCRPAACRAQACWADHVAQPCGVPRTNPSSTSSPELKTSHCDTEADGLDHRLSPCKEKSVLLPLLDWQCPEPDRKLASVLKLQKSTLRLEAQSQVEESLSSQHPDQAADGVHVRSGGPPLPLTLA